MASSSICQVAPNPNKTIGCQDLLREKACVHNGWLRRRSSKNRFKIFAWPQVYVIISGGCMYCYRNETSKKPADAVSLYGYDRVYRAGDITDREATWVFKIVHVNPDYRSYLFSASSQKEMIFWMTQFKQEMLRANGKLTSSNSSAGANTLDVGIYQDSFSVSSISIKSQDYLDIETSIYDDYRSCVLPTNYHNKKEEDDSDEELDSMVKGLPPWEERPPQPPPVPGRPGKLKQGGGIADQVSSVTAELSRMQTCRQALKPPSVTPVETVAKKPAQHQEKSPQGVRKRGNPDGSSAKRHQKQEDCQDFWSTIYFYEGKDKASEIIRQMPDDGVYLVRVNDDQSMVLHVYAENVARKFQIFQVDDKYTLRKASEEYFSGVEELVYFYYTNPLPNLQVCLCQCYVEHPHYHSLQLS